MIEKIDIGTERYIINRFVSMPKLFDELNIDYNLQSSMYCPFHENERTPAAKLYKDEEGYRLWCFSEGRMFGAWDIYKDYLPEINTNKLALMILNRLPEDKQKGVLESIGVEFDSTQEIGYIEALKEFRKGNINMVQLKKFIASSFIDD